ncbi:MAG: hypothetical protein ACP5HZ_12185 [Ferrimicrobium sp.]
MPPLPVRDDLPLHEEPIPPPPELREVLERMLTAWDGVETIEFSVLEKHLFPWVGIMDDEPADFMRSGDDRPPFHIYAWFKAGDKWRIDQESWRDQFSRETVIYSLIVNGDQWETRCDGERTSGGTQAEAEAKRERWFVGGLGCGRPYLSARDNAQLWYWSAPQLWVANLFLLGHGLDQAPRPDTLSGQSIVHVLASSGSFIPAVPEVLDPELRRQTHERWYTGADWDGDQEFLDNGNFFQLWVDMETGFIRRITKEETNGRSLDIAIPKLLVNQGVPDELFDLSG